MKDIIIHFYEWCFDFQYTPSDDREELTCSKLNVRIVQEYDEYHFYHNDTKIDIKNNNTTIKNIIKKLEDIFVENTSNL